MIGLQITRQICETARLAAISKGQHNCSLHSRSKFCGLLSYRSASNMPSNITESMNKRLKMEESQPVLKFARIPLAEGVGPAKTPERGSEHAAGFDLFSNVDMVVPAKDKGVVTTGLQIALPEGCYGRVAPRSGLAVNKFIDVGAGVIDRDYRGEVKVVLFNFSNDDFKVTQGMKIAQLVCERIFMPTLEECETLSETKRGEGGFGSTGTN